LKLLTIAKAPKGKRVAGFTNSGGDSTMLADGGEPLGLSFPQPSSKIAAELTELLPPIATVSNPLDYTTPIWGFEEPMTKVNIAMFKDGYDAAVLVQDYPVPVGGDSYEPYLADLRAFTTATRHAGIPGVVCSILPENIDARAREIMIDGGIVPMQGIKDALKGIARAAGFGVLHEDIKQKGASDHLRLLPLTPEITDDVVLDEWDGKRMLAEHGVPVPDGHLVDAAGAAQAAEEIGFPVVLKLASKDLPHKTEAGAVKVGLASAYEVEAAVVEITRSVHAFAPNVKVENFLIEKMVDKPVAELLVGIRRDEAFGLTMVIGSGGTLVELVADAATLLLPVTMESISEAIDTLKVSKLLDGFRGAAKADRVALINVIMALARFAEDNSDTLVELDVNPLMVMPDGVCAVDVLLRIGAKKNNR